MTKGEKNQVIDHLVGKLTTNSHFYLADLSQMTVEQSSALRGVFHQKGIRLEVVKNSLLQKALERIEGKDYSQVISTLSGNTCILFTETGNLPAKVIKDFRKKSQKPLLKCAFVEESTYVGDEMLDALCTIKSKDELIADIVALLQSPAKNVVRALQSGGQTLVGVLKTLSEKN